MRKREHSIYPDTAEVGELSICVNVHLDHTIVHSSLDLFLC